MSDLYKTVATNHVFRVASSATGGTGRAIPDSFNGDQLSLKHLAKAQWQLLVALGHVLSGYSTISKIKSTSMSPDGKLGGYGYVMGISNIRKDLAEIVEKLSTITDTIHDETNGPHWKNQPKDTQKILEESDQLLSNGLEAVAESEYAEEVLNSVGPKDSGHEQRP